MIRPATWEDIPWLLDAGNLAQKEAPHYAMLPTSPAAQYKRLMHLLEFPDAVCVCVVDDATGFIFGAIEPAIWFETVYAVQGLLWVHPSRRGSYRAWRLVAAFEEWAREHGATRVINGVSSGLNEVKVASFYTKLGYSPMGPSYFKELK